MILRMRNARLLLAVTLLLAATFACGQGAGTGAATPAPSTEMEAFDDPEKQRRYVDLLRQLRCLVCQNESLAESRAGLAGDLRRAVHTRIAAGRSDQEILDFMTERYGDFVLYSPPVRPATYALWFGPPVLLLLGLAVILRIALRGRGGAADTGLSEAERRRAAELLGDADDGRET